MSGKTKADFGHGQARLDVYKRQAKMEAEKNSVAYDNMEISGGRAVWKDVLALSLIHL